MPEMSARQQTRLEPAPAWTVLTDAPLKGLSLAREAGRVDSRQGMAHLAFVPARAFLLASAPYGSLIGIELRPGSSGKLDAELFWDEALLSNVGRLTTTGDGGMVLASCFTHGVQRY